MAGSNFTPKLKENWFDAGKVDRALTTPEDEMFRKAHEHSDVDFETRSLHHTLGTGPTQAAPGNHKHGTSETSDGSGIGTVIMTASSDLLDNYMWCDGAELSRTDFSTLFNAIGIRYGAGDGSTTFNLPDPRKRLIQGSGDPVGTPTHDALDIASRTATYPRLVINGSAGGGHDHTISTSYSGGHSHTGSVGIAGAHGHNVNMSATPDHSHSITGASAGSAISAGSGSGVSNICSYGAFNNHAHGGSTGLSGGHSHFAATDNYGNHNHALSTDAVNAHGHGGSTSYVSGDTHTHTGSVETWLEFNFMIKFQ